MIHEGFFQGIVRDLTGPGMFGGKFQIRLIAQPLLAILLGVRFGIKDARKGLEPFFLRLAHGKEGRGAVLKQSLRDAIVPLCIALVLDGILQRLILGYIRPVAALFVGTLLVWLPFSLSRAFSHRISQHRARNRAAHA